MERGMMGVQDDASRVPISRRARHRTNCVALRYIAFAVWLDFSSPARACPRISAARSGPLSRPHPPLRFSFLSWQGADNHQHTG
jgi:hypothetical protein